MNIWILIFIVFQLPSCRQDQKVVDARTNERKESLNNPVDAPLLHLVKTQRLIRKPFVSEWRLNGKVKAFESLEIKSEISGWISNFSMREGAAVTSNQIIVQIKDEDLRYEIDKMKVNLEETRNTRDEQRMLVGGGDFGQDSSLSVQQRNYIDISTGYNRSVQALKAAEYQLTKTIIRSPINGLIADRLVQQGQWLNGGEVICKVINPYSFEVEFMVIESVALKLKKGQEIYLEPIGDRIDENKAKIKTINPIVDENGLVKVKAYLVNRHKQYFEGMNVNIIVRTTTEPYFVIPKEAIVLRSNREVVFTYDRKEGLAKWNYVNTIHENTKEVAVSEGLLEGAMIIISGNLNLAHNTKVELAIDSIQN